MTIKAMLSRISPANLLLFGFLAVIAILSYFVMDYLTIDNIKEHKEQLSQFIEQNYLLSILIFFLACTVFVNSPVPFAAILKVLGGFLFGVYLGALYNIAATFVACLVGFSISRYALKESFEKRYYNKLKAIEQEVEKNGFYYFLLLRLVMVVPYFLINILGGISRLPLSHFVFSTMLGVIPASIVYANGGSKLEQINSVNELFRSDMVISFALVILILAMPMLMKKKII